MREPSSPIATSLTTEPARSSDIPESLPTGSTSSSRHTEAAGSTTGSSPSKEGSPARSRPPRPIRVRPSGRRTAARSCTPKTMTVVTSFGSWTWREAIRASWWRPIWGVCRALHGLRTAVRSPTFSAPSPHRTTCTWCRSRAARADSSPTPCRRATSRSASSCRRRYATGAATVMTFPRICTRLPALKPASACLGFSGSMEDPRASFTTRSSSTSSSSPSVDTRCCSPTSAAAQATGRRSRTPTTAAGATAILRTSWPERST